jgi:hypothetical protein
MASAAEFATKSLIESNPGSYVKDGGGAGLAGIGILLTACRLDPITPQNALISRRKWFELFTDPGSFTL